MDHRVLSVAVREPAPLNSLSAAQRTVVRVKHPRCAIIVPSGLGPARSRLHDGSGDIVTPRSAPETVAWTSRWDHQFRQILHEILRDGTPVQHADGKSVGDGRRSREIRNHQFTLATPQDRILWNPGRRLNVNDAIARFVWLVSGNDRVKDIEFYQPKVGRFTDDQLTVPGSNYGKRLFTPGPGIDQIQGVIERLHKDPGTRRALAAIYRPEDAVRDSADIPCAFGLSFHARAGMLHMTTIMRSNAAWGLLPYNVFEFTLLGELVAVLSGMQLGTYTHITLSMHLYEDEVEKATNACNVDLPDLPLPMPPVPRDTKWQQLINLAKWEADLRYEGAALGSLSYRPLLERGQEFGPYWSNFALGLLAYALGRRQKPSLRREVLSQCSDEFRRLLSTGTMLDEMDPPSLEDDPVMLESRKSLLNYASTAEVPTERREELWCRYSSEVVEDAARQQSGERRRRPALRSADWRRRDAETVDAEQRSTLFD